MRLLFDQNLSFKLCEWLGDLFPGSNQVRQLKLDRADDRAIWDFAKSNDYLLVTLDADFADMVALLGAPPKVIWLRCGNQTTAVIEKLLRDHAEVIDSFLKDDSVSCLQIL